jgi:hypothetical protein
LNEKVWIRSFEEGSTSGKGALLIDDIETARAWISLNKGISKFMISEVLPGRNFACNLLYYEGQLLQHAIYERLEYFMPHISPSGITGNISVGKLINEDKVLTNSTKAIDCVSMKSDCLPHGIYTVDLKGDSSSNPLVTEINLRHTAATGAFAQANWNMAEFQAFATMGQLFKIPKRPPKFSEGNLLLRDIDGVPVYIDDYQLNQNLIELD